MDIPEPLVSEVRSGRAVLFLGAGASFGALTESCRSPPSGVGLTEALSERFLGGEYGEETLAWVSELSSSATNINQVQDFVAELFSGLEPADFH